MLCRPEIDQSVFPIAHDARSDGAAEFDRVALTTPPCAVGDRLELVGGERLEDFVVHARDERAGPARVFERALERRFRKLALERSRSPAEVRVPHPDDDGAEHEREHTGDFRHDARREPPCRFHRA